MNNRKQKVESILKSLTQKELDDFITKNNINLDRDRMYRKLKEIRKPETHYHKIGESINSDIGKNIHSYYKLGQAWVIAFVLECFYDDKYKIRDMQTYIKAIIKDDDELKEMVYDCMKDL